MDNEIVFTFVALINSFILTYAMTALLIYRPKRLCRILVFVYLSACQIFLGKSLGQNITYFTIGGAFLIIILFQKHVISNIIFASLGYLLAVALNYALTVPMNLAGYTLAGLAVSFPFILIFMFVYGALVLPAAYFLGKYIRNYFSRNLLAFPLKIKVLFLLELLLSVAVCIFNIMQGGREKFPSKIIYYNATLFITFFIITFIIFSFCLHIMQKNHELLKMQQEKLTLEDYTKKLETLYQDMRIFKHDYINILSTMQYYIDSNDTENLKEYFTAKILPGSERLTGKNDVIGKLSRIKVLELKGILYVKLVDAMNQGLAITLEIPEEVTEITMEMLDFSTVIGVFMDNAVEAAADSEERKILIAIYADEASETIVISNSSPEMTCSLDDIYEREASTKSGHNGLGLYSVRKILDKYPNVIHSTRYDDHIFTQSLEICKAD